MVDSGDIGFILGGLAVIGIAVVGFRRAEWDRQIHWIVAGVVALGLVLIGWAVYDHHRWTIYRDTHNCSQTGETKTVIIQQCNMIGKVMVCSPSPITQHEWKCDGDEIVWR